MFPAPAGMSRWRPAVSASADCVPRTRGDEPCLLTGDVSVCECSPCLRGNGPGSGTTAGAVVSPATAG